MRFSSALLATVFVVLAACTPKIELSVVRLKRHPIAGSAVRWNQLDKLSAPRTRASNYFGPLAEKCGAAPRDAVAFTDYVAVDKPAVDVPSWTETLDRQKQSGEAIRQWAACGRTKPAQTLAAHASFLADQETVGEPIASFFHMSDAQVRDARVKLGNEAQSRGLDNVINTFEHEYEQELFLELVLDATVATMNDSLSERGQNISCADPRVSPWPGSKPAFAIHTGDAVDAGVTSEFQSFHAILDRLRIPWLSAVGNHDVLVFGNLLVGETSAHALAGERLPWWTYLLYPIVKSAMLGTIEVDAAVQCPRGTNGIASDASCNDHLIADTTGSPIGFIGAHAHPGKDPCPRGPVSSSNYHGFDLLAHDGHADWQKRGYYAFDYQLEAKLPPAAGSPAAAEPPSVPPATEPVARRGWRSCDTGAGRYCFVGIVLNTSDFSDADQKGGAEGFVSQAQLDWFKKKLAATTASDLVFVFAHHPIRAFRGRGREVLTALEEASRTHGNVVAYVTGHHHEHNLRFYSAKHANKATKTVAHAGRGFWEIETAGIIEFPQEQRLITVKKLDDDVGFIELLPFKHTIPSTAATEFAATMRRSEVGAKRDHCKRHRCIDNEPMRTDGDVAFARLFFYLPAGAK